MAEREFNDGPVGSTRRQPKVDIALLQTFHLVARTGSFSAAARELNLSYQSAANHVRRLEQMYGARLIETEQGSRRITLTAQGKALHASLGEELDTILSRISVLLHDVRSVLRVGVPQALFHHFFPGILRDFRAEAQDIDLAFFERDTLLESMMLDGALDAAVSERSFNQPAIAQHELGSYRLALVWPRAWEIDVAGGGFEAVIDRPFISYEAGQALRTRSVEYLTRRTGRVPHVATSASGSTAVTQLVRAGLGFGVTPDWAVPDDDPQLDRVILHEIEPVKIWFSHTAFLGSNRYVRLLRQVCEAHLG
ncbi:LysR family transcriptional regulator (plasmid) [Salipiger sp. H15]|uniref:LysR family transcriptional regulator n=1 Tax=Alloyangia sp. H15 TaxID=3029062 RepID=A0AAU8APX7_9RHOB